MTATGLDLSRDSESVRPLPPAGISPAGGGSAQPAAVAGDFLAAFLAPACRKAYAVVETPVVRDGVERVHPAAETATGGHTPGPSASEGWTGDTAVPRTSVAGPATIPFAGCPLGVGARGRGEERALGSVFIPSLTVDDSPGLEEEALGEIAAASWVADGLPRPAPPAPLAAPEVLAAPASPDPLSPACAEPLTIDWPTSQLPANVAVHQRLHGSDVVASATAPDPFAAIALPDAQVEPAAAPAKPSLPPAWPAPSLPDTPQAEAAAPDVVPKTAVAPGRPSEEDHSAPATFMERASGLSWSDRQPVAPRNAGLPGDFPAPTAGELPGVGDELSLEKESQDPAGIPVRKVETSAHLQRPTSEMSSSAAAAPSLAVSTAARTVWEAPVQEGDGDRVPRPPSTPLTELPSRLTSAGLAARVDGRQELHLRLDPPHLGEIDVVVEAGPEGVRVRLVAHSPEAMGVLQGQRSPLQEELARHQIRLESFSASLAGGEMGGRRPDSGQTPPRSRREPYFAASGPPRVDESVRAGARTTSSSAPGGLDTRV